MYISCRVSSGDQYFSHLYGKYEAIHCSQWPKKICLPLLKLTNDRHRTKTGSYLIQTWNKTRHNVSTINMITCLLFLERQKLASLQRTNIWQNGTSSSLACIVHILTDILCLCTLQFMKTITWLIQQCWQNMKSLTPFNKDLGPWKCFSSKRLVWSLSGHNFDK